MSDHLKQILVHFDDSPAALVRLDFARALATEHEASVNALYAVTPWLFGKPFAAEAAAAAASALRDLDEERVAKAKLAFDNAIDEKQGARAQWGRVEDSPVAEAFQQQALYSDVLVLGQRGPYSVEGVPFDFVETTIVTTGKPALVVPYTAKSVAPPRHIAIAWKPTREAARAVNAALPLLRKAKSVNVMTWGSKDIEGIRGSHMDLDSWLRVHGIEASWHRGAAIDSVAIGEMLLTSAFELDADLLVMGCYGHSRAREWVLGGASRTVLEAMTLPVLMTH